MDWMSGTEGWIALLTLTLLEIVLGIDNIVFISILAGKLKPEERNRARSLGLTLAMGIRILLLLSISWVMGLTRPLFGLFGHDVSGRDLILLLGGLFLIAKSTHEIHGSLEGEEGAGSRKAYSGFASVIVQIMVLDIVFSLDSVITAVGMVNNLWIMISAVVVSIIAMMLFAGSIGAFVMRHPTVKMLALSFLLLIGVTLVAEAFDQHISKGYIYFAMAFSVFVEMLNMRIRKGGKPVQLNNRFSDADEAKAVA